MRVWPEGSEHNRGRSEKDENAILDGISSKFQDTVNPSLMVFRPSAKVKAADFGLGFCPGGGYGRLSMFPPSQMVEWINALGGTVAILKYHVPRSKDDPRHLVPLADAQRALSLLRSKASEFGLDKNKIGIAGSSAGGHLAFHTSLEHENRSYSHVDQVDEISCRPDFTVLFYPAYLGANMKPSDKLDYSKLHTKKTAPIFITGASDDKHLAGTYAAMPKIKAAKVPFEAHIFNHGGHGGMFEKYPMLEYAAACSRFLNRHGIMTEEMVVKTRSWLEKKERCG